MRSNPLLGARRLKAVALILTLLIPLMAACERPAESKAPAQTLAEARRGFVTHLLKRKRIGAPVETPPEDFIKAVTYTSPVGELAAYLCRPPGGAEKRPAIIWLVGGFSSSVSGITWADMSADNDQSGSTFWKAGIITMYPSLRGGNENPGNIENFFGEVDDVVAAAEFLAKQPGVDPARIYLGGHSTGGTLAMLVAEMGVKFRAVFAFGPIDEVENYGDEVLVYDTSRPQENELRAPVRWMHGIVSPVFAFEGTQGRSNIASLRALDRKPHPKHVVFLPVRGADHFSDLRPISQLIARKILADTAAAPALSISAAEVAAAMKK